MKKIFKKEIILVLFLAFAVLGVSGCVRGENQKVNQGQDRENKEVKKQNNKEKNEDSAIIDWQTYINEEIGYEIKYPETWECKDPEIYYYAVCKNIERDTRKYEKKGTIPTLDISRLKNATTTNPVEYLKNTFKERGSVFGTPIPEKINYEISGQEAVRVVYTEGNEIFGENEVVLILFEHNNELVEIEAHLDIRGEKKQIIEKMIESIKLK